MCVCVGGGTDQPWKKGTQGLVLIKSRDLKWPALERPGEFTQGSLWLWRETLWGLDYIKWKTEEVYDYQHCCLELALLLFPLQISLGSPPVTSTDNLERGSLQTHRAPIFILGYKQKWFISSSTCFLSCCQSPTWLNTLCTWHLQSFTDGETWSSETSDWEEEHPWDRTKSQPCSDRKGSGHPWEQNISWEGLTFNSSFKDKLHLTSKFTLTNTCYAIGQWHTTESSHLKADLSQS